MRIEILGVPFDVVTKQEMRRMFLEFLSGEKQRIVVTPNPEFLVTAKHDREFKDILRHADLSVADGIGIVIASRILGKPAPQRITGNDVVAMLSELSAKNSFSLFLFGGKKGVGERAAKELQRRYPGVKIAGWLDGVAVSDPKRADFAMLEKISSKKPDILLVALGQGKQEAFMANNLKHLPSVRISVGIGGVLDYLSGEAKRAPAWMQAIGMEWLFRLLIQPSRLRRIVRAVVVFPWYIVAERLKISN